MVCVQRLQTRNGIVIVPPLNEAPISKPTPTPNPGADATPLPGVETTPKPDATENPVSTNTPTVTEKPGATVVPTEQPSSTDKPTVTENPTATNTPAATENPSQTPSATDNPTSTEAPSEPTASPKPTPTPDIGDGAVVENKDYKYRVYVWDNGGALMDFGLVKLQDDGNLEIELPSTKLLRC